MSTDSGTIDVAELAALNTKKQTAEWAGVSTRQIDILAEKKEFPKPVRVGSHPRWRKSDLLNWLDTQSKPQSSDD